MVIHGSFGAFGRPHIVARVQLPRLSKEAQIAFVVDTGADQSLLSAGDSVTKLGIDYQSLRNPTTCHGVGGPLVTYPENARIIFGPHDDAWRAFEIEIGIAEYNPDAAGEFPSLLGRDILDESRVVVDRKNGELYLSFDSQLRW